MVGADGEIALLATVHDELLNGTCADVERLRELGKAEHKLDLNRVVDLGQLLEEAGENNLLERANVLFHTLISTDLRQDGGDLLANGERMEIDLKDVVKIADLRAGTLEQTLAESVLEEDSTSRSLRHAEQVGKARVLVLPRLINVNKGTSGAGSADDWDSESGEEDKRRSLGHVGFGDSGVVLLGALTRCDGRCRLAEEVVVPAVCGGVEEVVLADQEDAGELLEVVGHHDVLGRALAQGEQGVDVLNTAEGLLPQLEFHGHVQLLEAGVEVAL